MKRLLLLSLCSSLAISVGCDADGDTESSTVTTDDSQGDPTDPTDTTSQAESSSTDPTDPTDTTDGGTSGGSTVTTEPPTDSDGDTSHGSDSASTSGTTVTTEPPTDSDGDTTDGADPELLCERTDGVWDANSCGHYICGNFPECDAIDPGCDCGPDANFVDGEGCVEDEACDGVEFACGDELFCSAPSQYCSVVVPGQPPPGGGNGFSYACVDTPDECADDYSCECPGFASGPASCEEAEGGVTVTIFAP